MSIHGTSISMPSLLYYMSEMRYYTLLDALSLLILSFI